MCFTGNSASIIFISVAKFSVCSKEWKVEMIRQRELFIMKLLGFGTNIESIISGL